MTEKINDKADSCLSLLCWSWGQMFHFFLEAFSQQCCTKRRISKFQRNYEICFQIPVSKQFLFTIYSQQLLAQKDMYLGIDKYLNGTVCLINIRKLKYMYKFLRSLKNLIKNLEKLGFSFVMNIQKLKILSSFTKRKTTGPLLISNLIR